ncbi:MAG: NAD-dependent epimerase/dehydratase family protein [Lentisphaeria bacterium]|nr:NAD-dependent epimerase/dehydratase family protein [Lentisphaeria bacterium]
MRILILGASGFVGTALGNALSVRGHEVLAADVDMAGSFHFDLAVPETADKLLQTLKPDTIVLLAGASSVGASWKNPSGIFELNTTGAIGVFESFLKHTPDSRLIFAGSSEEYGRACSIEKPFNEDDICTPSNPYALSKHSAAQVMKMLAGKNSSDFVHLRLANHFGPGQRKGFVIADFASQIAEKIKRQDNSPITAGNLEAMRDFLFIDDVIDAYIKVIEAKRLSNFTYNVGAGKPIAIKTLLELMLEISGCGSKIVIDPQKFRQADTPVLSLDSTRIKNELKWQVTVPLKTALERTLDYWSSRC